MRQRGFKNTNFYYQQRENVQIYYIYTQTCVCLFNALNLSTFFRGRGGNQVCRLSLSLQMLSEIYNIIKNMK